MYYFIWIYLKQCKDCSVNLGESVTIQPSLIFMKILKREGISENIDKNRRLGKGTFLGKIKKY